MIYIQNEEDERCISVYSTEIGYCDESRLVVILITLTAVLLDHYDTC